MMEGRCDILSNEDLPSKRIRGFLGGDLLILSQCRLVWQRAKKPPYLPSCLWRFGAAILHKIDHVRNLTISAMAPP